MNTNEDWYTPVKNALEVFTTGARVNFQMWGEVLPVFGYNFNGEPMTKAVKFTNPADKENFRLYILDLIRIDKLKEFVFVSEAWTVKAQRPDLSDVNEWMAEHGSLANHPDRREIVSVLYCSPTEEIQYTAEINRGTIPASLGEWHIERSTGRFNLSQLGTRFQGLFAQGTAGQN